MSIIYLLFFINRSGDENNNEPFAKKFKVGSLNDVNDIIDEEIKRQNEEFFQLQHWLKTLKLTEKITILKTNAQLVPKRFTDVCVFQIISVSSFNYLKIGLR